MIGIFKIAFKLLVNDRGKFAALLTGITFAVFLMVQLMSVFAGILSKASATIINVGASVWVMDPAVNNPLNSIQLPDYILDSVRSINGVKYAVPLYSGVALVKLHDGFYQPATVIGLDDTSLVGRPELIQGNIADIFADDGFIVVQDSEYYKLQNPTIGTTFEINDHRAVVIGLAKVTSSTLFGIPTLYTTFTRAIQYIPSPRFTIAYILVEPKAGGGHPPHQGGGGQGRVSRPHQRRVSEPGVQLLQIRNRGGHQHLHHDLDQFPGGPVHLRPDLLHLRSGEPH